MKDTILQLDDRPIDRVGWFTEEHFEQIQVGSGGITKIDCVEQYCGDYSIWWIQAWKDNKIFGRYNSRNVDTIVYEDNYA